jgi:hydrogenase large subunit
MDQRGGTDIAANLVKAIEARRRAHEMGAVFGGRMPAPHTYIPGGFTAVPTAGRITTFRDKLTWLRDFIDRVYIPDVEALSSVYDDYLTIGEGCGNFLAYGVFDQIDTGASRLLERGRGSLANPNRVQKVAEGAITESVAYSWYDNSTNDLKPANGSTKPVHPRTKTDAYSWLKAPRYKGKPYEAGPLARMWVNGDYRRGASVMDRHLARAHEAKKIADAMTDWLDQFVVGAPVFNTSAKLDSPSGGSGVGLTEAARGALGHWVSINGGKIASYQVITPTCWNASPQDTKGVHGPMEQALIGTPVAEPDRPIEALRVIHSFDPCLSCAVHIMKPEGEPVVIQTGCK